MKKILFHTRIVLLVAIAFFVAGSLNARAQPGLRYNLSCPHDLTVVLGQDVSYTVSTTPIGGFNDAVTLTFSTVYGFAYYYGPSQLGWPQPATANFVFP